MRTRSKRNLREWTYRYVAPSAEVKVVAGELVGKIREGGERLLQGPDRGEVALAFVNCKADPVDSPSRHAHTAVIEFTERYGPLLPPPAGSMEFRMKLADWYAIQEAEKQGWDCGPVGQIRKDGKAFRYRKPRFVTFDAEFVTSTLRDYIGLSTMSCPYNVRRKCQNVWKPGPCGKYFRAESPGQKHCSPGCAENADLKTKRKYWAKNYGVGSPRWKAKQARKRKRAKDARQKR